LEDLLSMTDLRRGKRVHFKSKIGHSSLAHFLLMRDAGDREQSRLLLRKRERRSPGFLGERLAVDIVTRKGKIKSNQTGFWKMTLGEKSTNPIVQGGMPSSWN
jgi:hypothetical protein